MTGFSLANDADGSPVWHCPAPTQAARPAKTQAQRFPAFDPERIFMLGDADLDGRLSLDEYRDFLRSSPRMRNAAATIEPMFRRLDADRDGFLSLAEYRKSFPRRPGGAPAKPDAPKEKPPGAAAPEVGITPEQERFFEAKIRPVLVDAVRQVPREHRREAAGRAPSRQPRGAPHAAATPARRSSPASPTRACSSARSATATKTSRCPPRGSSPTRSSPISRPGSGWAPPTRGPGRPRRPRGARRPISRKAGSSGRSGRRRSPARPR